MTYRETVVRGRVSTQHVVQLFDSPESLADTVSAFLAEGLLDGDAELVVATARHWDAMADRLDARGIDVASAMASGQLTLRDAAATLALFMRHGAPEPGLFDDSIGTLVRELVSRGRPLRIYGEMVDLLALEGDFRGAQWLEECWNALGEKVPFTLFCGYSAVNFGAPRSTQALRSICAFHSHVLSDPGDILGTFLVGGQSADGELDSRPGR